MTRYSVQHRDRVFVKGYGFLSFAKNVVKNIGKNIIKNLSGKCCQKRLDHAKKFTAGAFKTVSKRVIKKEADATGELIYNKIADRITKVSKTTQQNTSETATNKNDEEIPKERSISPEERQKILITLILI